MPADGLEGLPHIALFWVEQDFHIYLNLHCQRFISDIMNSVTLLVEQLLNHYCSLSSYGSGIYHSMVYVFKKILTSYCCIHMQSKCLIMSFFNAGKQQRCAIIITLYNKKMHDTYCQFLKALRPFLVYFSFMELNACVSKVQLIY